MIYNLIIGKNSNLSVLLHSRLENCFLLSSRELMNNSDILLPYKDKEINIIFNNFQTATMLNDLSFSSKYIESSILSTSIVLDFFNQTKINKIIYTSSSSVYGNNILCNEKDELKPLSLHAAMKVSNEKLIEKYCLDREVDFTITRIFNMYGGNDRFSIISKIIDASLNKKKITLVNNGNAVRDFIHINDVIEVYSKLMDVKNLNILNIGTGNGISIKTIIDFLKNKNIEISTNNILKDELKVSTASNLVLNDVLNKNTFEKVEDYLLKELNL